MKNNFSGLASTGDPDIFAKITQNNKRKDKIYTLADIQIPKSTPQWNLSSAVLRHSSSLYSMPKDRRFKQPRAVYNDNLELNLKSTLSSKTTSFGIGKRTQIPTAFMNNKCSETRNVPFYQVDDMKLRRNKSESIKAGKTISAVGWDCYSEVYAPHRKNVHNPEQTKNNPGMKYNISGIPGQNANKISMHGRLKMFSQQQSDNRRNDPSPQNYFIIQSLVVRQGSKSGIGIGKKLDFTKNNEMTSIPGPIYNISGFCDKFKVMQAKNFPKISNQQ